MTTARIEPASGVDAGVAHDVDAGVAHDVDAGVAHDVDAGVDVERVTAWLVEHVEGVVPPLSVSILSGGRSNLTYRLVDATGRDLVLRRPPLGNVLQSAHDVGREHRIIAALAPTDVPVAGALGHCDDAAVIGAPFYVMTYVAGVVLATAEDAARYPVTARRAVAAALVDVLARLHAVDPDAVGLGELGRKAGYLERQLRRWHTQFQQSKTRELPVLDEVHRRLVERMPPQRWTGIVHGDYRLGNLMVGEDGGVRAVLDWELATLGDTLADVGWLLSSWLEPGETSVSPFLPPTTVAGFPTRTELAAAYAAATDRDLSDLPYYVAFSRWRSACIGEGVLNRYRSAVMGDVDFDLDQQAASVEASAEAARTALDQLA